MIDRALSRRQFLAASAVVGGSLAFGWQPAQARPGHHDEDWLEASAAELQTMMTTRRLNSRKLTRFYLERIDELNPVLGAVIETNPDALRIARNRDEERRRGRVRGPLHGIPVIVKDNIATRDRMQTTAGSLALVGSRVAADAPIVAALRRAGAVIIGKSNLSEWANFRGGNPDFPALNGWSGRGGFTRNPYRLDLDPCGSSSGSGSAAAANLCAIAVGTETDGSILCPSGEQSLVGIKPTLGLVAQQGIIPIAASQDTAGPMCRSVADAAALLNVLRTPFGDVAGQTLPADYTAFLDHGALSGARLAVDLRYVDGDLGVDPERLAVFRAAVDAVRGAGATVEELTSPDPRDPLGGRVPFDDEFTVLLFEFKVQVAEYLATVSHTPMRTLADLIQFNLEQCDAELRYFGQEVFEAAEATSGDLTDPEYLAAARTNRAFGRNSIDSLLAEGFDAVITPSFSFGTSPAATGGYPSIAVPVGFTGAGGPVGFWMSASFLEEPKLIALGSAIEHLLQARRPPTLAGDAPPEPPRFPGCPDASVPASRSLPKSIEATCACAHPAR
jgi:amidase